MSASEAPFLWGVATSAYQCEGGFNGPDQPHTNWAAAEQRREVEALGRGAEFWLRYREDFAICRAMGLSAFRLGIEWSRVQPAYQCRVSPPPPFDEAALNHYAGMLGACRDAGLEPVVSLHHFVHPAWLGPDPWLDPATPELFARFVRKVLTHINRRLCERGHRPIRYYLTINEPNMLVLNTYLGRQFPTGARRGIGNALSAVNQLLRAHVLAYNGIHELHAVHGWGQALVSLNTYASDLYWTDKFLLDLLAIREREIRPAELRDYLHGKGQEFDQAMTRSRSPSGNALPFNPDSWFRRINRHLAEHFMVPESLRAAAETLYASPRAGLMDYLALDYYDPFSAHIFRAPSLFDHELKNPSLSGLLWNSITSKWWDWRVLPEGLHFFCDYYSTDFRRRPVLIAENGLALRRSFGNQWSPRKDRISRSHFLGSHIREIVSLVKGGTPVFGYLHWSLFDNYEWGSFTPRFGLFSLDYQAGLERLSVDHHGDCPSATYAEMIREANALFGAKP